nr:antizyme inhibitor 2 isoform X2 [Rattus norvegicus]
MRFKAEMELVQHIGVPASKIICANPCKQVAQIKYAAKHGVRLLSFDNEVELAKVVKSHPSAKMVLCIATQDSHSLNHLSLRFGASLKSCRHLLENAKQSHVEVVGVSFHIGSGCPDPQAYAQSIADARLVFQMGAELGHTMNILDLGGGFPGLEGAKVRFEEMASVINSALDLYFPEGCGVDILAELGRYYVTSAFTVAVSIVAKKEVLDQPSREEQTGAAPKSIVYHLDEGVYGVFNSVLFDNTCPTPALQKYDNVCLYGGFLGISLATWLQSSESRAYTRLCGHLMNLCYVFTIIKDIFLLKTGPRLHTLNMNTLKAHGVNSGKPQGATLMFLRQPPRVMPTELPCCSQCYGRPFLRCPHQLSEQICPHLCFISEGSEGQDTQVIFFLELAPASKGGGHFWSHG